ENEKDALAGASDIIAERVSDNAELRKRLRALFLKFGVLSTKAVKTDKEGGEVYETYADYQEPVSEIKSYRTLAVNRGEDEGFLRVKVEIDVDFAHRIARKTVVKAGVFTEEFLSNAADDGYDRLIAPSIEREIRNELTDRAEEQAIKVFEMNLKNLLMRPALKGKIIMGFDPGIRTGCKIAVVDPTGKFLDKTVVYPTQPSEKKKEEAKAILSGMIKKWKVDVISIGNGTASRESEQFVSEMIQTENLSVSYIVENEAGASVYSASKIGKEEFPDFDVSERSAVSIARRVQDPLSELIKIDPKSIGVGQYQHDMPEKRLDSALAGVLEDCVNAVGVNINTASYSLLTYVAGLNSAIAKNIVEYREQNGVFTRRNQVLKVPKLGEKAYKQCAGFLRVADGENVLDNTGVHPESYPAAEQLLKTFSYTLADVKNGAIGELRGKVTAYGVEKAATECGVGVPTLNDIVAELMKPGRDVRDKLEQPLLRTGAMDLSELKVGTVLKGTVRNVTDFGAFVDIGVHQDGLVHISALSDRFIRHPSEVVKVGDQVTVSVLSVDVKKQRIGLTMKGVQQSVKKQNA
ncbi:MAG: RNA-binding transcriptional accessory protein, partial [Clostridia bacterium]|nr:RNA-binding transcriptional accessory protein [Clostridia bacterium]